MRRLAIALICVGVGIIITTRLLALGLPLIITNDSVEYIAWGKALNGGEPFAIPPLRTPGYSWFLAGVFSLFGVGPTGVVLVQHLLGAMMCFMPFLIGLNAGFPLIGMFLSVLLAVDPFVFSFETYALSETLTMVLVCLAALVVVMAPERQWVFGIALGVTLGLACLTRPAVQALVPFFIAGWALRAFRGYCRFGMMTVAGVAALLTVAPWLNFNAQRGIFGLARGFGTFQWIGLCTHGLLAPEYSPAPDLKEKFDALGGKQKMAWELVHFVLENDGFGKRAPEFSAWARAGILRNPVAFLSQFGTCVLWHLNYFPSPNGAVAGEVSWFVLRAGEDGTNDQFDGEFARSHIADFESKSAGGPVRWVLRKIATNERPGLPQIPLFAVSLLLIPVAIWRRRRWDIALVSAGALLFLLLHAAMLIPWNRYSLPMQPVWYLVLAASLALIKPRRAGEIEPGSNAIEVAADPREDGRRSLDDESRGERAN